MEGEKCDLWVNLLDKYVPLWAMEYNRLIRLILTSALVRLAPQSFGQGLFTLGHSFSCKSISCAGTMSEQWGQCSTRLRHTSEIWVSRCRLSKVSPHLFGHSMLTKRHSASMWPYKAEIFHGAVSLLPSSTKFLCEQNSSHFCSNYCFVLAIIG